MADVVAWLEAELRRVEELARAATPGPWEPKTEDPGDDEVYTVHDGEHGDLVGNPVAYVRSGLFRLDEERTVANMRLIASFADPASVLRRVAADRQILAEHQSVRGLGYVGHDYREMDSVCTSCGTPDEYGVPWPCRTVLLLAEGYGWTGDQRG